MISPPPTEVPFWRALTVSAAAVAIMAYFRLAFLPERVVPLADTLPLLLCLWHRNRRILFGMCVALTAVALVKVGFYLEDPDYTFGYLLIIAAMYCANSVITTAVLDVIIRSRRALQATNAELTQTNEELTAREEEISHQNEELQSQTEELERQAEELRHQTEELEAQSEEAQLANSQLSRRESVLEVLLTSTQWLSSGDGRAITPQVCEAAVHAMNGEAAAAAILILEDGALQVRGHWGFGDKGPDIESFSYSRSLAGIAMERRQSAYIKDIALRPDLTILQPFDEEAFCSVLAAPLIVAGSVVGAIEVLSREPRDWSSESFQMLAWFAAQASLALETNRLQQQASERRREAEESSIRKTRFLAAVSHDVRTPANAISLLADVISRSTSDPEKASRIPALAKDLKRTSKSLIELVSDVLDIARFDSGRVDVHMEDAGLRQIIESEVHQHYPAAASKGLSLETRFPTGDFIVHTDRPKLARVLGNLIGNAVKFTKRGGIEVNIEEHSDGSVAIHVKDTGIGVPPDQLENIFDEFHQLENPERDRSKGTGLGLAICKRLVEGLECRLTVSSSVGTGSVFTVHIPSHLVRARSEEPSVATPAPAEPQALGSYQLSSLRVLLVEDHHLTRHTTAEILAAEGATVIQAAGGNDALRALRQERPQVMLLDLMLPDIDGTEVLREIAPARPPWLERIIVISGAITPERIAELKNLGADQLLSKPIDPQELISSLLVLTGTHAVQNSI